MARVGAASSWRRDIMAAIMAAAGTGATITAAVGMGATITAAVGTGATITVAVGTAVVGTAAAHIGTAAADTGTEAVATGGDRPRRSTLKSGRFGPMPTQGEYVAASIADSWRDEPSPPGDYPRFNSPIGVERERLGALLIRSTPQFIDGA
jgi:hypothetical protein